MIVFREPWSLRCNSIQEATSLIHSWMLLLNLMLGLPLICQSWSIVGFGYIQYKLDDIYFFVTFL